MRNPAALTAVLCLICFAPATAAAAGDEEPALRAQVKELTEKVQALEKRLEALEKKPGPPSFERPEQAEAHKIPAGTSPVLGSKKATIDFVIYGDYQCPFTARAFPLLSEVVNDPALKGKVRVVFKHFPLSFHVNARSAAKAAMAARELGGDDKFWAMSGKLFENQRELTDESYVRWAQDIGLDGAKFTELLKKNDAKYEEQINADMKYGESQVHVRGTPSLFVGGWELRARSVEGVKQVIADKKLR